MGISRQAHYQWQQRRAVEEVKHERVLELVQAKRLLQPRLGTRKLHHLMSAEGQGIGRDALFGECQDFCVRGARRLFHGADRWRFLYNQKRAARWESRCSYYATDLVNRSS